MSHSRMNGGKYRIFLTLIFIASSFFYLGPIGKAIDDKVGVILFPLTILFSFIAFVGKASFRKKNLIFALVVLFSVIAGYVIIGGGVGSVINNVTAVIYIFIFSEIEFGYQEYRYFSKLILVLQGYLGLYTLAFGLKNGYIGDYNSNTVGFQLLLNMLYLNAFSDKKNRWVIVAADVVTIGLLFYVKSRISFFSGLLMVIFIIVNKLHLFRPGFFKFAYILMTCLGILVPVFYVVLFKKYDSPLINKLMHYSLELFHKNIFTGREYIWGEAFERMLSAGKNILFGIGSNFSEELGNNFHSSYMTLLICGGTFLYLTFMAYLYSFFRQREFSDRTLQLTRLFYLIIMLAGLFESTLFSGHFSIICYMLMCASSAECTDKELKC